MVERLDIRAEKRLVIVQLAIWDQEFGVRIERLVANGCFCVNGASRHCAGGKAQGLVESGIVDRALLDQVRDVDSSMRDGRGDLLPDDVQKGRIADDVCYQPEAYLMVIRVGSVMMLSKCRRSSKRLKDAGRR